MFNFYSKPIPPHLSIETIERYIRDGLLRQQWHPSKKLMVLNYTEEVQFNKRWDSITLASRGLILDTAGKIIARPLPKFFNMEELPSIPNEPYEVHEKLDGSLGILYWLDGQPAIATRGSFTSWQAEEATKVLHEKYSHLLPYLDQTNTYLFEIILPDNRIVVNYGDRRDLILLAQVETKTGLEKPLAKKGFPIAKKHHTTLNFSALKKLETKNSEGFVIRFESGLRMKIKFETYLKIHRVVTNVSTLSIWDLLRTKQSFTEFISMLPDELYNWVKEEKNKLEKAYSAIEEISKAEFEIKSTRKETALNFLTCSYPKVLFALLDKKPIDQIIWKHIKPNYEKPRF